jgi:hypothetical protein
MFGWFGNGVNFIVCIVLFCVLVLPPLALIYKSIVDVKRTNECYIEVSNRGYIKLYRTVEWGMDKLIDARDKRDGVDPLLNTAKKIGCNIKPSNIPEVK